MSGPLRILVVAHNHPHLYVGGAEVYAHSLCRHLRTHGEVQVLYLARTSDPAYPANHESPFHALRGEEDDLLWTVPGYDDFWMTTPHKEQYTLHFARLLRTFRPHLVHIQHVAYLGLDILPAIRHALPSTPIVMTLHEFLPICHADGHMRRATDGELCSGASPARCSGCFPHIPPGRFVLREHLAKAHLDLVDLFLAPSRFLLYRYVEWGLPADRMRVHHLGQEALTLPGGWEALEPPPSSFAYVGQIRPHKGLPTLLRAFRYVLKAGHGQARLVIHGSALEEAPEEFRSEVSRELEACNGQVRLHGRYDRSELPSLLQDVAWLVVPSVWWENAPLVIQEAFLLRRPVLCGDVGGMAEQVTHAVDGLHFRIGDAGDLARTLQDAMTTAGLWQRLSAGIRPPRTMTEDACEHLRLYHRLVEAHP